MPARRSFFGFPFLKNHSQVDLLRDVFVESTCSLCGIVCSEITSLSCAHRLCVLCLNDISQDVKTKVVCPIEKAMSDAKDFDVRNDIPEILSNLKAMCFNRSKGCDYVGPLSSLQGHYSFCQYHEVQCQLCKSSVLRRDLIAHVHDNCAYLSSTPLQEEANAEAKHEKLQKLEVDNEDLNTILSELKAAIVQHSASTFSKSLQQQFDIFETKIDSMYDDIKSITEEKQAISGLCESNENLSRKLDGMQNRFTQLSLKIGDLQSKQIASSDPSCEMNAFLQQSVQFITPDAVIRWKVSYTQAVKEKFIKGDSIKSEKFFSHFKGYYLYLLLRGVKKGDDDCFTRLGAYLYTAKGPYDGRLDWPFRWNYSFRLINHKDDAQHINFKQDFNKANSNLTDSVLGNPNLDQRIGWGAAGLISLQDLDSDRYIKDGTFTMELFIDPLIGKVCNIFTEE